MSNPKDEMNVFDQAAQRAVDLGNQMADADPEADPWDIASGLLAGAVHFWLYSRHPCGEADCEDCEQVDTAEKRLRLLLEEARQSAVESDYYHAPTDANVGRA